MQATERGSGKSLIRLLLRGGLQSPEVEGAGAWTGMLKMRVVGLFAFWACFQGWAWSCCSGLCLEFERRQALSLSPRILDQGDYKFAYALNHILTIDVTKDFGPSPVEVNGSKAEIKLRKSDLKICRKQREVRLGRRDNGRGTRHL